MHSVTSIEFQLHGVNRLLALFTSSINAICCTQIRTWKVSWNISQLECSNTTITRELIVTNIYKSIFEHLIHIYAIQWTVLYKLKTTQTKNKGNPRIKNRYLPLHIHRRSNSAILQYLCILHSVYTVHSNKLNKIT